MRNNKFICLILSTCIVFIALIGNAIGEKNMDKQLANDQMMDNDKLLATNLTKAYDINELKVFFQGSNANEGLGLGITTSTMLFSDVNRRFPVEILRSEGYSVYRVRQGGYFYVFWVNPYSPECNQSTSERSVYFSTYLTSAISPDLFASITPGVSTAQDVMKIDPYFELSFLNSCGVFSYSYLNDKTILQIEYTYHENINKYDDLIVKEMKIVARDSVPSRFSSLLSSDLP